jgi:hypothetical protein
MAGLSGSGTVDALSFSAGDVPSAQTLLSVTFNPSKSKIAFAGFQDEGSSLLLQSTGSKSGTQGTLLTETPMSGSTTYSNTSTTMTIGATFTMRCTVRSTRTAWLIPRRSCGYTPMAILPTLAPNRTKRRGNDF